MVNPSVGVTIGANRVYYFESTASPSLIWVRLEKST
ncbi:hypothetical protein ETAA8_41000 [Anatilimnocola aggregata]|uniref:Uncharacterized protein n=1 Tax=Anatilimnocola aggregata TaxID=2528021 RepID=A0A517YFJ2_9BACT|nr:hypothetical protein ETAA8_41000 [Anatilimnocola aggregata]